MWNPDHRMRLADVVRRAWWQHPTRPPEAAPDDWGLGRDLDICRSLIEREGWDATELADALELYDGPPATLAIVVKKELGLRSILHELHGKALKRDLPPPSTRGEGGPESVNINLDDLIPRV